MSINLGPAGPAPSNDAKTQMRSALGITMGTPADIHAATSKATPVDADEIPLSDSAASWGLKKLTWSNLKATIKAYFDTIYLSFAGAQSLTTVQKSQAVSNLGLVITRTAEEGPPYGSITVTGVLTSDGVTAAIFPTYLPRIAEDNFSDLATEPLSCYYSVSYWVLVHNPTGASFISDNVPISTTPDLVGSWTPQGSSTGTPIIAYNGPSEVEIPLQKCYVGTTVPLIFESIDGETWSLVGPSGVVNDTNNFGLYRHIIFDGLALSSEAYTPAD